MNNLPRQPVEFKPTYETCEFITSCIMSALVCASLFFLKDTEYSIYAMTALCSSYIISRGLFKKDRMVLLYSGFKTSEFKAYVFCIIYILLGLFLKFISVKGSVICGTIIQLALNGSRGYVKSLTKETVRTIHL